MKKWIIPVLIILSMMFTLSGYAMEPKMSSVSPKFDINGTTATCQVTVSDYGKEIEVTMELWCGSSLINSWDQSGNSIVSLSESCKVTKGKTYTLKTYGTADDVRFTGPSVSKTC